MGGKSRKISGQGAPGISDLHQGWQQPPPEPVNWAVPQQTQPQPPQPLYGPLTQAQGWDMTQPGMAEQFANKGQMGWMQEGHAGDAYSGAQGALGQPGAMEEYYAKNAAAFGRPTASQGAMGLLPGEGDFGAFYDRAKERTASDVNNAMAARGMFGSSAALDQLGQSMTDLDAHRANREADYALQRAGLGGQLAGQADQSRLAQMGLGGQLAGGAQSAQMGRIGQGFGMASQLDQANDARRMQGMSAFGMADNLRRMRGRDYMNDMMGMAGATSGQVGMANQNQLGMDMALMDQMIQAALGYPREALNQDYLNQQTHRSDWDTAMSSMGTFMGGGMEGK